jgi:hypothetical protein
MLKLQEENLRDINSKFADCKDARPGSVALRPPTSFLSSFSPPGLPTITDNIVFVPTAFSRRGPDGRHLSGLDE